MSTQYFIVDSYANENHTTKILYITQSSYDAEWNSTLHTHQCTELFYITKGKGIFRFEKEMVPVKADDMIIVNPMIMHTEQGQKQDAFEYIAMGISGILFQEESEHDKGYFISNYFEYKHEVLFYLKTLLVEAKQKEQNWQAMCQCLLEALIINIIRRSHIQMMVKAGISTNQSCALIESYIDKHFKEEITLETLSQISYLNKFHIAHAFKEYKGMPPISYVRLKRIEESQFLLTNTNISISEIASIVGFSSLSYFTQAFKRYTHLSPIQYRRQKS